MAFAAGVGNDLARAVAGRAGALDHEETLLRPHLAVAAAGLAAVPAGTGLRAAAVAAVALRRDIDGDRRLLAVIGVLQADLEVVAQVGPAQHAGALAAAAATAHELAEDILEDVREALEPGAAALAAAETAILERSLAIPVIGCPLLRVLQAVIGLADRP